jgi:hypothetical protein
LFITSQHNDVSIKVEVDDVIEENSIDMETDEVYTPSACSINKVEPKVSFVSDDIFNSLPPHDIAAFLKSFHTKSSL